MTRDTVTAEPVPSGSAAVHPGGSSVWRTGVGETED